MEINNSDIIYLSKDYECYISMAVHDHILNSLGAVFIMAFLVGFCFGFAAWCVSDELKYYIHKLIVKGQK